MASESASEESSPRCKVGYFLPVGLASIIRLCSFMCNCEATPESAVVTSSKVGCPLAVEGRGRRAVGDGGVPVPADKREHRRVQANCLFTIPG